MNSDYIIKQLTFFGVPMDDAITLAAVVMGESSYNAQTIGDSGNSIGLFQIHIPAHKDKLKKHTGSDSVETWINWLKLPDNNIRLASEVYHSQGLGAWTVYNEGIYNKYLGQKFEVVGVNEHGFPDEDTQFMSKVERLKAFLPGISSDIYIPKPWEKAQGVIDGGKDIVDKVAGFDFENIFRRVGIVIVGLVVGILMIIGLYKNGLEGGKK